MENSPGLLIQTNPLPPLLNRLVLSPSLHMKQDPSGALVVGEDFGGGPAPDDPWPEGRRHFERLRARLPSNAAMELAGVTVGDRVIPAGGLPAVGPARALEGLTIAVMHSGVTLAPLVGRLVATEILDEIEVELLAPYRPARFA